MKNTITIKLKNREIILTQEEYWDLVSQIVRKNNPAPIPQKEVHHHYYHQTPVYFNPQPFYPNGPTC